MSTTIKQPGGLFWTVAETISVMAAAGLPDPSGPTWASTGATRWTCGTSQNWVEYAVPVMTHSRIKAWRGFVNKTTGAGPAVHAELYKVNSITGAGTKIGSTQSNATNNPGDITLGASGLDEPIGVNESVMIRMRSDAGSAGDSLGDVQLDVTRPYLVL